jgi:4a-hydroxytetrahydrobiopterin dehydratase
VIAHSEDHHPDIQFGYKKCAIRFNTHAVGGITDNDFICAAKVGALV